MQMEVTLQVKNVTIIGSGLMGHGIALKFAQYNCNVIVYDPNDVSLDSLFERIVRDKLQIMNKVATIAVALVKKLPLDLENI